MRMRLAVWSMVAAFVVFMLTLVLTDGSIVVLGAMIGLAVMLSATVIGHLRRMK